jgi:RNA polymerase subunit RPABC4/transcription elongation factor Spt4
MLYCKTCRYMTPEGYAQCVVCKNGFTTALTCASCQTEVPRGQAFCQSCDSALIPPERPSVDPPHYVFPPAHQPQAARPNTALVPSGFRLPNPPSSPGPLAIPVPAGHPSVTVTFNAPAEAPPVMSGLPAHIRLPNQMEEYHRTERPGFLAEVFTNGADNTIMNEMAQTIVILHTMAEKMTRFAGHMDSTRRCIKGLRNLASDLQEEIEVRRGNPNANR